MAGWIVVQESLSILSLCAIISNHAHTATNTHVYLVVQKLPSRVSAVQALILSAYFDVGVGAMASAWHATGLALRTALDIGLNRPVDEWVTPEGTRYFTKTEVETCRRAWYGVLLLEKYVPVLCYNLVLRRQQFPLLIATSLRTLDDLSLSMRMITTRLFLLMTPWMRKSGGSLSRIVARRSKAGLVSKNYRMCPYQGE